MIERLVALTNSAYWGVICLALGALVGGYMTADHYRGVLAEQELEAAVLRAEQGKKAYEKLVEAQNGLDTWRRTAADFSESLERMRSTARTTRTSADACRVERAAVAKCESLLAESVELLAEGAGLSERNAAVHDALASAVK